MVSDETHRVAYGHVVVWRTGSAFVSINEVNLRFLERNDVTFSVPDSHLNKIYQMPCSTSILVEYNV